ncbi:MAG: phage portal protein [Longimicrobiales bacterium]|nr:phage portal protein [Longimicrobiales bacterium]
MPTIKERLIRYLQGPIPQKPKTYPGKTLGTAPQYFQKRDPKLLEYRRIYEQGGPVSEAVDCYPLMMLSNGYRVEGPRQKDAEQFMDDIDFETIAWKLIVDAVVVKVGLAEIIPGRAAEGEKAKVPIAKLDHRFPETFEEIRDDFGTLEGYKQRIGPDFGVKKEVDVKPENMFRLDLGLPLIERAYDDIMRDAAIISGTAKSIERHGFPRYHITVGEAGETIPKEIINDIGNQFEGLKPSTEMVTAAGVNITNIDNQGVQNAKMYNDWSMQRVCSAMGTPEELLGLGRGVLTGEIRFQGFYNKIGTLQKRFARQFNTEILDRWAGKVDQAWLVFNDVSPVDESQTADLIQKLTAFALDPWQIVSPEWCRKRLDISEDEYTKWEEEQDKLDAEQAKLYPPPPNPFMPQQTPSEPDKTEEVK